jgi:hypothetical protein
VCIEAGQVDDVIPANECNSDPHIQPLPFTHLEPKRFEDLVRQLVYDFRPWRRLEATGRSGSDDGFDARALDVSLRRRDSTIPQTKSDSMHLTGRCRFGGGESLKSL